MESAYTIGQLLIQKFMSVVGVVNFVPEHGDYREDLFVANIRGISYLVPVVSGRHSSCCSSEWLGGWLDILAAGIGVAGGFMDITGGGRFAIGPCHLWQ